jgi:hypothetical protein
MDTGDSSEMSLCIYLTTLGHIRDDRNLGGQTDSAQQPHLETCVQLSCGHAKGAWESLCYMRRSPLSSAGRVWLSVVNRSLVAASSQSKLDTVYWSKYSLPYFSRSSYLPFPSHSAMSGSQTTFQACSLDLHARKKIQFM